MTIELEASEKASGFYGHHDTVVRLVGISARHYIAIRIRDGVTVHITGNDAAAVDDAWDRVFGPASLMPNAINNGYMFALMLDAVYIQQALKAGTDFVGVGLIDTGNRPRS